MSNSKMANANKHDPIHRDYLETDAGQVYFWTAGSGPDVLFIHQSGNSSEEYAGLTSYLADRCRMVALDLPGHGRSDDPIVQPTLEDYCSAVMAVIEQLNIKKAHIVGNHGGALAAINLGATYPERFDKIILSGIGGPLTDEEQQAFVESIQSVDTSIRSDSGFVTDAWNRYIEMMSDGANAADIIKPFVAFMEARLRPYRGVLVNLAWDREPAQSNLRGPVLLVQGSKDPYVHNQEGLLDIIADSKRIEMPGCGAFMFYDRPKQCAKLVADFFQFGELSDI